MTSSNSSTGSAASFGSAAPLSDAELTTGAVTGTLMASAYWLAWAIIKLLATPWDGETDSYNCDALLGSTERQLFAVLRSQFDARALAIESGDDAQAVQRVALEQELSRGSSSLPRPATLSAGSSTQRAGSSTPPPGGERPAKQKVVRHSVMDTSGMSSARV